MHSSNTMKRDRRAAEAAGEKAEPERARVLGRDETGIGADQHHALDADVEHPRLFRDLFAEPGQQQRHAGGDGAEEQARRGKAR